MLLWITNMFNCCSWLPCYRAKIMKFWPHQFWNSSNLVFLKLYTQKPIFWVCQVMAQFIASLDLEPGSFVFESDLKLLNAALGLQNHAATCPCAFCEWVNGCREKREWPLRTFEGIRKWNARWRKETGGDRKLLKYYRSCQGVPLKMFPSFGRVIDTCPLPQLHLKIGAFNTPFDGLLGVAPEIAQEWAKVIFGKKIHKIRPSIFLFSEKECKIILNATRKYFWAFLKSIGKFTLENHFVVVVITFSYFSHVKLPDQKNWRFRF